MMCSNHLIIITTINSHHYDFFLFCFCPMNKKMGNIHVVGPNEALIVTGGGFGCCHSTRIRMIIGSWIWVWWSINNVQLLSLEIFTMKPKCENVQTVHGVPLCVTAVAQCRITKHLDRLRLAAEQFLGMTISQIRAILLKTLEGHLRAILGWFIKNQI